MDRDARRRLAFGLLAALGVVGVAYGVVVRWLLLSLVGATLAVGVVLSVWRGPRHLVWTLYLTGAFSLAAAVTAGDWVVSLAMVALGAVSLFRGREYHRLLRRQGAQRS